MELVWTKVAKLRRREIFIYIAADNIDAARALDIEFQEAASKVLKFPQIGRKGFVEGTREIVVHTNYILVYRLKDGYIQILTIHHAARSHPLL